MVRAAGNEVRASDVPTQAPGSYQLLSAANLDTTPSTSYTDRTSGLVSVTKARGTESNLRVDLSFSGFTLSTNSTVTFGVRVDSVDYDVCRFAVSAISTRAVTSGAILITGLSSGAKTVQLRHKAVSGATVLRQASPDDFTTMIVSEVDA